MRARGRIRTRGRYGAATVRGTRWSTIDRCESHPRPGTLVVVSKGLVAVRSFALARTVLVPAGRRFIRASAALGTAVTKIAAVPPPSADAAKLTKWIGYLKQEKTFLGKIGKGLKAQKQIQAPKLAVAVLVENGGFGSTE